MEKLNALWQQWIAGPIDQHTDLWGIHVFWLARIGILMQLIGIAMIVIHAQRETSDVQQLLAKARAHAAPLQGRSKFYIEWYSAKGLLILFALFVLMAVILGFGLGTPGWVRIPLIVALLFFGLCVLGWFIPRQSRVLAANAEETIKNFAMGWPLLVMGTFLLALGH